MSWTPKRVALLRKLWTDPNETAATIAVKLGITRNAVIGKANRMDNPPKPRGPAPSKALTDALIQVIDHKARVSEMAKRYKVNPESLAVIASRIRTGRARHPKLRGFAP